MIGQEAQSVRRPVRGCLSKYWQEVLFFMAIFANAGLAKYGNGADFFCDIFYPVAICQ